MPKKYDVRLSKNALEDLVEILLFVSDHDSPDRAEKLTEDLYQAAKKLSTLPKRGLIPKGLEDVRKQQFLEIHYKKYHILYSVREQTVEIHGFIDGRRDIQEVYRKRGWLK
jgi:toxin ParE1/3/4